MTTVADSEASASGRYIDFSNTSSAHNNTGAQTILAYVNPTGNQEGTFGYVFGKTPAGSTDGLRLFISDNGGSPRFTFGAHSSGGTGAPNKNSPSGAIAYGSTWYVIGATWDGTINLSGIDLYINKTKQTGATGNGGSGTLASDASNRMFLLNRGNSGNLGRALIGNAAWIARWNRVLDQTEIDSVVDNGPLSVPSGLILCWANGQDYSSLALSPAGRSTRVAGSAPPNTALGDSGGYTPAITEAASLAATHSLQFGAAGIDTEAATASSSQSSSAAQSAALSESAALGESTGGSATGDYTGTRTEAASLDSTAAQVWAGAATQTEAASAAESCGVVLGKAAAATEGASLDSSQLLSATLSAIIAEAMSLAAAQSQQAYGHFICDTMENGSGSVWASTAAKYNWLPSWRIGDALPSSGAVAGSGTFDASGVLRVLLPLGQSGVMMYSKPNTDAGDDDVAYMHGTVV